MSPYSGNTASAAGRAHAGLFWLMFLVVIAGCEPMLKPPNEPDFENPQDPNSPEFVEPETLIIEGPSDGATIGTSSVTFTWTGNEGATLFQSQFDGSPWSSWATTASATFQYLDERPYSFSVRSAYPSGEGSPSISDPTPASRTFTVDAVQGPSLRLTPPYAEASVNTTFQIELVAEEVVNLMAVRTVLSFDSSRLTVLSISDEEFFSSTGGSIASYHTFDNVAGTIVLNIGTAAGSPLGVTGSGTVLRISLRGKTVGDALLQFLSSETDLRNPLNQDIAPQSLVGAIVRIK